MHHCIKGFVILTVVFLIGIVTVAMALWDATRIVPVTAIYGQ